MRRIRHKHDNHKFRFSVHSSSSLTVSLLDFSAPASKVIYSIQKQETVTTKSNQD